MPTVIAVITVGAICALIGAWAGRNPDQARALVAKAGEGARNLFNRIRSKQ